MKSRHFRCWQVLLQKSFCMTEYKFPGRTRDDQTILEGTTLSSDELTGDFGNGLEATSIGDCGSFGLFAGN